MIYPQNFEQKTGFDQIRRILSEKCLSPLGEERVTEMTFSSDYETVNRSLTQTEEFVRILREEEEFPANYFFDVRYSLKRIRPEGTWLDEKEVFDLRRSLQTIQDIVRFFRPADEEEETPPYPALQELTKDIVVFPQIISRIDAILDKFGHIKDNASPALAQIRREITLTMSNISRNLQSILRVAQSEGVVDKDVAPTMRDGRLMIPVAPAFKRKIKGIVHDESASGKTVFIEPEVVVEANNRVRELESDERREIIKILTEFTGFIRPLTPDILRSYEFLADIDFIRAKALFAEQISGIKPVMENRPIIDWIKAVHPLLFLALQRQNKAIVPLDITLEAEKRLLVISGPNAGGKSVCLKTVGLLQYMLQCGLLIPVYESSKTGLFENLFIDIGDEQSIENDLSTYSSHLTNMKYFVKNCNEKTLLLIDEFGSGTEPQIGGAIAEALLDRFNHGELIYTDSIHFPDSLQYQTLKSKRIVYGGGGIMPDVFVPLDTTIYTDFHRDLLAKGVLNQYPINYLDKHRKELTSRYKNVEQFVEGFTVTDEMLADLLKMGEAEKVKYDEEQYQKSRNLIALQVKALVARDMFDTAAYFRIMNPENPSFVKAMAIIHDDAEYNRLLQPRE